MPLQSRLEPSDSAVTLIHVQPGEFRFDLSLVQRLSKVLTVIFQLFSAVQQLVDP